MEPAGAWNGRYSKPDHALDAARHTEHEHRHHTRNPFSPRQPRSPGRRVLFSARHVSRARYRPTHYGLSLSQSTPARRKPRSTRADLLAPPRPVTRRLLDGRHHRGPGAPRVPGDWSIRRDGLARRHSSLLANTKSLDQL